MFFGSRLMWRSRELSATSFLLEGRDRLRGLELGPRDVSVSLQLLVRSCVCACLQMRIFERMVLCVSVRIRVRVGLRLSRRLSLRLSIRLRLRLRFRRLLRVFSHSCSCAF